MQRSGRPPARPRRFRSGVLLAALAAALVLAVVSPPGAVLAPAAAATSTVLASADAHVASDAPGTNYGTASSLRVDGSPTVNAYLRFDLSGLDAPPAKVTLRLYAASSSSQGVRLHRVSDTSWTESGLTWANAPAPGPVLVTSGALTSGTWLTLDVTSQVTGNGPVSFAVSTLSSTSRRFVSREGSNRPQLLVETGTTAPPPSPGPAPPPGPTGPFTPTADAYVRADAAGTNYGSATALRVDGSPVTTAYLRFAVTGLAGQTTPPGRVTLRVYARTTSGTGLRLHRVSDTGWSEQQLTYTNAPPLGPVLTSSGALTAGTWVSFDVTNQVTRDGPVGFALTTTSSSSRTVDSREAANPPQLVIEQAAPPPPPGEAVRVAVAGDVACAPDDPGFNDGDGVVDRCHMKATAQLVSGLDPAALFALGDLQYNNGRLADFQASYDLHWGTLRPITRPVVGNHEYGTAGAAGYFGYFGDAATPRQPGCRSHCEGYYSFDLGAWHVVVLNSECAQLNGGQGCSAGSPQQSWLAADLAAHPSRCTVALTHKPLWSSNSLQAPEIRPLVQTLYDAGVDLMLAGHSHSYERFAPQDPAGNRDDARGLRELVVGTGGSFFTGFSTPQPHSEVRKQNVFGVLSLTLRATGYDWSFVADLSTPFSDSGSQECH